MIEASCVWDDSSFCGLSGQSKRGFNSFAEQNKGGFSGLAGQSKECLSGLARLVKRGLGGNDDSKKMLNSHQSTPAVDYRILRLWLFNLRLWFRKITNCIYHN